MQMADRSYQQPAYDPYGGSYGQSYSSYGSYPAPPPYYPAASYGDDDGGLLAFIVPLVFFIIIISMISTNFNRLGQALLSLKVLGGKSFDPYTQITDKADEIYKTYLKAVDNEECRQRLSCELGDKLRNTNLKYPVIMLLDKYSPDFVKKRLRIVKEAAFKPKSANSTCEKYQCSADIYMKKAYKQAQKTEHSQTNRFDDAEEYDAEQN